MRHEFDIQQLADEVVNAETRRQDLIDTRTYTIQLDRSQVRFLIPFINIYNNLPFSEHIKPLDPETTPYEDEEKQKIITVQKLREGLRASGNDDYEYWGDIAEDMVSVDLRLRDMDVINDTIVQQINVSNDLAQGKLENIRRNRSRQERLSRETSDILHYMPLGFLMDVNKVFIEAGAPIRPQFEKYSEFDHNKK